jgi:alpha-mannosidase
MKDHLEKTRTVPQRAQHVLRWLSELECWRWRATLPLREWRVAAGDGEGRPIAVGDPWPTRQGVLRFEHGPVRVPEDWPLADTRLLLDVGGEARVLLDHGDRVQTCGSDPYHRALPVGGRSFTLRVEAVARDLFGAPQRDARLRTAFLALQDPELAAFLVELRVLHDGVLALADHDVAPALLELAEVELARLPWPTETVPFLERIAEHPEMLGVWERAVDPPAAPRPLAPAHREALAAATVRLHAGLAALAARWPKVGRVAVAGHAHIDYVWLWPQPETVRKALRTFGTQLELLERWPAYRFVQSQACLYADVEAADPALFARIAEQVRAGRWEPVGGMWVECDTNLPSAEAFNRQLLYGQSYFRSRFGVTCRTAWLPDTFGFSAALPPILQAAGLDAMLTIKVTWNETDPLPDNLFRWQGVDGTAVLVHTFEAGPWGAYNMDLAPRAVQGVWRGFKNKTLHDETLASFGWGDGGGGPTPDQLERIEPMNRLPVVPEVRPVQVRAFFDRLRAELSAARAVPVWRGELYLEYHRATLTTQGRTKRLGRRAEGALVAAELCEGLVWLAGGPEEVAGRDHADAWKVLLRNQFHDALPGSSIREVYELAERELSAVLAGAEEACARALGELAGRVAPGADPGIFLANAAGSPSPNLKLERPEAERFTAGVLRAQPAAAGGWVLSAPLSTPPLAARFAARLPPPGQLAAGPRRLENALVRVELDEAGRIASLFDKRRGREALAGPGNQLWAYKDRPRTWDAWDLESSFELGGAELTEVEAIDLTERGPHRAELRVTRRFGERSRLVQRYRLWADSARLDVATAIELHDRRTYLRARFPLAVLAEHATYDQALGAITRPTHDNTSWQRAQFEASAHRFADLSEAGFGVALLNDGKYGHSAKGNVLTLSLVRGPTYPDPLADEGLQEFTYALLPHDGRWWDDEVQGEADDLNGAVRAAVARGGERLWQPVALGGVALRALAFKRAEDGRGRVLRVAEARGGRGALALRLPPGFALAEEVDTLEDAKGAPRLAFTPFVMRSWRVMKGA